MQSASHMPSSMLSAFHGIDVPHLQWSKARICPKGEPQVLHHMRELGLESMSFWCWNDTIYSISLALKASFSSTGNPGHQRTGYYQVSEKSERPSVSRHRKPRNSLRILWPRLIVEAESSAGWLAMCWGQVVGWARRALWPLAQAVPSSQWARFHTVLLWTQSPFTRRVFFTKPLER